MSLELRVRRVLEGAARGGRTLTYQALAQQARSPSPHRIHNVALALEALIREDHAAGRPLLASLVVSRIRDGLPAPGFFQLLRELGYYQGSEHGDDAARFHAEECRRVWSAWRDS